MRASPAPWLAAILALISASSCTDPAAAANAASEGVELVISRELAPEPTPRKDAPEPERENALALKPIHELRGSRPASASISPVVVLAAVAAFLFANIAALLGIGLLTRLLRERREARGARFRGRWEPVLYARMAGDAVPLPPLARSERTLFLELWLHTLGYVRDEAVDALTAVAKELDLPRHVLPLLDSRSPLERLLAMRAAGSLRLTEAAGALQRKAAQRRPRSSLEAARALLKIDAQKGFAALQALLARLEWSPGAMAGAVRTGGPGAARMLAELLASLPPGGGRQVVRVIELLEDQVAIPALRERLLGNRDAEEIAVILHALGKLGGAPDRAAVLALLAHRNWLVRMQAAAALGALGLPEDADRLVPLLRDPQWWVRYRAAQALLRLRGDAALRGSRAAQTDRYASEILDRVLAEGPAP